MNEKIINQMKSIIKELDELLNALFEMENGWTNDGFNLNQLRQSKKFFKAMLTGEEIKTEGLKLLYDNSTEIKTEDRKFWYGLFREIRNDSKLLSESFEEKILVLNETNEEEFWIHYNNTKAWVSELLSLYKCQKARENLTYCIRCEYEHDYHDQENCCDEFY